MNHNGNPRRVGPLFQKTSSLAIFLEGCLLNRARSPPFRATAASIMMKRVSTTQRNIRVSLEIPICIKTKPVDPEVDLCPKHKNFDIKKPKGVFHYGR